MTARQFVGVALRLFAIWLALLSIQSLLSLLLLDPETGRTIYLAFAATYALFAAMFWFFPMKIAGHVLNASPGDDPAAVSARSIVQAGVIVAGLLIVSDSIPPLGNQLWFALSAQNDPYPDAMTRQHALVGVVIPLAQLVLGLLLVFRSAALSRNIQSRD